MHRRTEPGAADVTTLNGEVLGDQYFRSFIGGVSSQAIYLLDPTGKVHSWNAGAGGLLGYTPKPILGQHLTQLYTTEDREAGVPQRLLDSAARDARCVGQ